MNSECCPVRKRLPLMETLSGGLNWDGVQVTGLGCGLGVSVCTISGRGSAMQSRPRCGGIVVVVYRHRVIAPLC